MPEETSPATSDPPMNEDGHVLKSRRGLLAAGLAVAVVGALGVASTLNAGAEEIPAAQDAISAPATADATPEVSASAADPTPEPSASVAAATDGDTATLATAATPPALLPWGARPQRISKGRPGANAAALRTAGLDAADADTSGSEVPDPKFGPKGRSAKTTYLKSEVVDAPPPQPAATTGPQAPTPAPSSDKPKANFMYSIGSQGAVADGLYANLTIAKPTLNRADYHTLAELSLQTNDGHQVVEVGWNVDRVVNGDDDPHLFVYHWVNGESSCYNGCGFEQFSTNLKPGDTLAYGVTKKFGIQFSNNSWWIAFDSEWIGFFPEKLWTDEGTTFMKSEFLQVFGEVAAVGTTSCTQMGNGQNPTELTAARASGITFVNGPPLNLWLHNPADRDFYPYAIVPWVDNIKAFRFGGPVGSQLEACKAAAAGN